MVSSRLFWKLWLAYAGLSLVATALVGFQFAKWYDRHLGQQAEERLRDAALLVRGELTEKMSAGHSEELQRRVRQLGAETGMRLTLVAMNGQVLADSSQPSLERVAAMDNHRHRPEVVLAIAGGEGSQSRVSTTLGESYRYFAIRADSGGGPVGLIRVGISEVSILADSAVMRRSLWGLVAAVWLGAAAFAYWFLRRSISPLGALKDAADAIAAGDYQHRVFVPSRDELGALSRTFNRMSHELHIRMSQLSQLNDRQSTVLGGMIEGVIAVDARQRIVLANKAAGRLFEFRPAGAEGRPLLEVVRNHALHQAVTTTLATRRPQRLETHRETPDKLCADVHVTPMPGDPCPGVVLVVHDTTELRRLESLRRDFMANVSHELKTPLSSIKAYTETLRNGALHDPEAGQKFLERIAEQADRLHHLILDMLTIARIESDQQAFEIVSVSVQAVVEACVNDRRPAAEAKEIFLDVAADQPACLVQADEEGLREILDNLVDNAIKYTPAGGNVRLGWRCERRIAYISVADTGIGIGPEDRRRVFERFYRVDKARSRELGGTGLGLSIVKHLTQAFGGKVSVESEPGRGSTFTVQLPLA